MRRTTLVLVAVILANLAGTSVAQTIEGTLLFTYRNMILMNEEGGGEQVILLPDMVAYTNARYLQELEPGNRLRLKTDRSVTGIAVSDSVERVRPVPPFDPARGMQSWEVWEKIASRAEMALIDLRSRDRFDRGHLPGARSLPASAGEGGLGELLASLGLQKDAPVILYAEDEYDGRTNDVGKAAVDLGYSGTRLFAAGMAGWLKDAHFVAIAPDALQKRLGRGETIVVADTRPEASYGAEHLPAAVTIDAGRLDPTMIMRYDTADPILFYGSDDRDPEAGKAADKAVAWGYHTKSGAAVMVLEGGIAAWKRAGLPLETGSGNKMVQAPAATRGMILFEEFKSLWQKRKVETTKLVLDVRSRLELAEGKPSGVVHIPVDELPFRLSELPKDREIIAYCSSGRRSRIAAAILQANGFPARYLGRMLRGIHEDSVD